MADYDSDSDSSADNDDVSTNVLLGYASEKATGDDFSQLGGLPTWLDDSITPPDGRLAKCKVCSSVLCLLLQLNADLPDRFPGHQRRLYVLGCRRKACRRKAGSVRAIRALRTSEIAQDSSMDTSAKTAPVEQQKPATNLGETLFGVKSPTPAQANPFAPASAASSTTNPFASSKPAPTQQAPSESLIDTLPKTFAEKARIDASDPQPPITAPLSPEAWPTNDKPYTQCYLDAESEYLDPNFNADPVPAQARLDTNGESSSSGAGGDDEKSLFESSMDKTFQRFADRLAQNPEQVLRYEFGGQPLLYAKSDAVGKAFGSAIESAAKVRTTSSATQQARIPRCGNCGSGRLFELQLTPHAIAELEADEVAIDGMEWGTVIVGVCGEDCQERGKDKGQIGYLEEWVGVQWEEVADHRAAR